MYNTKSTHSIIEYGKKIESKSLNEFIMESDSIYTKESEALRSLSSYNTGKGSLGQLVEEIVFGYNINSNQAPDFEEVGMELKVVPLKYVNVSNKSKAKEEGLSVKERISLSMIDYCKLADETWETNTLSKKLLKLLLMFYIHDKELSKMDYKFKLVEKWEPSGADLRIIRKDWETIVTKIRNGEAHNLSEGDTLYLGAATKGSSSKITKIQPFNDLPAKQRAFSLKRNFVEDIFNNYLLDNKIKAEDEITILDLMESFLKKYKGKKITEILVESKIEKSNAKHWLYLLCNKLIAKEFGNDYSSALALRKAGVEMKTILLQESGIPKEAMSFEQINYQEIVEEEWENSFVREKFENKKHLWLIFKATKKFEKQYQLHTDDIILDDILIWNMPINDLEGPYKDLWEDTAKKVKHYEFKKFLKQSQNRVGHIRPKARNSKDKVLFNGQLVPKKAFWLNSKYVASEIKRLQNNS